jgi:hypothetical protein
MDALAGDDEEFDDNLSSSSSSHPSLKILLSQPYNVMISSKMKRLLNIITILYVV